MNRSLTCCLWKDRFSTESEYENTKKRLQSLGYRVVTYIPGSSEKDMLDYFRLLLEIPDPPHSAHPPC